MSRVMTRSPLGLALGAIILSLSAAPVVAAEPASGAVSPSSPDAAWQGKSYPAGATTLAECPSAADDPYDLVCDHFAVDVAVDPSYWDKRAGGLLVDIDSLDAGADFDLDVYDAAGNLVGSSGNADSAESVLVAKASGSYEVRVKPWLVTSPASYAGVATLTTERNTAKGGSGGSGGQGGKPVKTEPLDAPDLSDKMWNLEDIRSPLANQTTTGNGVVVAVIDTGVDIHHPEFQGRFVAPMSWVCPEGVAVPCGGLAYVDDGHSHGTHVAGTVAAAADGVGVTGVAPEATIMPIRVGDDEGSIVGDLAAAVRYATAQGADVITVSIGYIAGSGIAISNPVIPLDGGWGEAIQEAADAGILVTLAAGNDGTPYCGQGNEIWADSALCVAAYGPDTDPAVYTDWGLAIDIAAPGGGVLSCAGGIWSTEPLDGAVDSCTGIAGYGVKAGTSMATPHVAGLGALLAAQGIRGAEARQRIIETARTDVPLTLAGAVTGPRIDAAAAVDEP